MVTKGLIQWLRGEALAMTHNFYRNSLYYRASESCFLARILSHSPEIRLAGKVFSGNGPDFRAATVQPKHLLSPNLVTRTERLVRPVRKRSRLGVVRPSSVAQG